MLSHNLPPWKTVLDHIQDAERGSCFECSGLGYKTAGEGYLKFCECVRGETLSFVIRNCRWTND